MKVVSMFSASTVIGGALNPIEGLVKGAQLGYTTGAEYYGYYRWSCNGCSMRYRWIPGCTRR